MPELHDGATPDVDEDAALVERVLGGDVSAFAVLTRRYNRRLFRVVRAIVRDDAEAEDVCQEAWLRAYRHLDDLHSGSKFSTWLARIGYRFALARVEQHAGVVALDEHDVSFAETCEVDPEEQIDLHRVADRVERAIDELPPGYRAVILLRDVEHMSTNEVADVLELSEENVRVRLHRARANLRQQLVDVGDAFRFDGERCLRLTRAVLARIFALHTTTDQSEARYATRSAWSASDSSSPSSLS
jgi:RNA polymerase sigma-70 factor (ECF subfamily)